MVTIGNGFPGFRRFNEESCLIKNRVIHLPGSAKRVEAVGWMDKEKPDQH